MLGIDEKQLRGIELSEVTGSKERTFAQKECTQRHDETFLTKKFFCLATLTVKPTGAYLKVPIIRIYGKEYHIYFACIGGRS